MAFAVAVAPTAASIALASASVPVKIHVPADGLLIDPPAAATIDTPVGTVMSRLFRARRQLEGQLKAYAAADYNLKRAA